MKDPVRCCGTVGRDLARACLSRLLHELDRIALIKGLGSVTFRGKPLMCQSYKYLEMSHLAETASEPNQPR